MESVATNYLIGEEQVCRSWADYINANLMTAGEAIAFVRDSISSPEVMVHILSETEEGLTGLSTVASVRGWDVDAVSYQNMGIFSGGLSALLRENSSVNVTRTYTNPINAIQSIAFYCPVTLYDEPGDQAHPAVLLRIIPVSVFEKKWVFPTED